MSNVKSRRHNLIFNIINSKFFQVFYKKYLAKMSKDQVVLSYDESLLRKSDVDLLKGNYWLNDNIISFYFEYLKNTFKDNTNFLFVSPEVTQCIKIIPDSQMKVFLDPLDASKREFIFLALNDNDNPHHAGGTHWSLLVFALEEETAYHYDSGHHSGATISVSNNFNATLLTRKLCSYFDIDDVSNSMTKEVPCLNQNNGYDCGIFLICNAEHLAKHLFTSGAIEDCNMLSEDIKRDTGTKRKQILELVERLRLEGGNAKN